MAMHSTANAVIVPIVPAIRLRRVLLATDFSEASRAALPLAVAVTRKYGSQLYVAHICPSLPYTMAVPEATAAMLHSQEREAWRKTQEFLKGGDMAGLTATVIIESGKPVDQINRIVRKNRIDLVILSTHGRTGVTRFLLGSIAEELFRGVDCPVLTVGPHISERFRAQQEIRSVLFPTDLSQESIALFPYVASLASEYRARITVLHVVPVDAAVHRDAKALVESFRKEMERIFTPEICPRCEAEFVVDFGDPVERILAYASKSKADLIGMGVTQAAEVTTHFRTTIAYRVVLGAECPALTSHQIESW